MEGINPDLITKAGYKFTKLDPNIYVVHDFATPEECKKLIAFGENSSQEAWEHNYIEGIKDRVEARYGHRDLEKVPEVEVTHNWHDKVINFSV